jgi:alginate O-acetyltransferase complex protein AlgI
MVFSSPFFLFLFLPVTLTVYWVLPPRLRDLFLLAASLLFYVLSDQGHVFILFLAIAANYIFALALARERRQGEPIHRRGSLVLTIALAFNLDLLIYCKYGGFLVRSGVLSPPHFRLESLPLGISFFTFGLMSYVIDVHQKRVGPERSFLRLATYVSLFPKVVAGPIVRYRDLTGQLGRRGIDLLQTATGVRRFVLGLAKKVLIANEVGLVADEIFSLPVAALSPWLAWVGALCFTIQIYYDFSGYSDMAIGLGKLFGFEFPENFNYPYVARSIREFWQKWHISLSSWFRDYLFQPLAYAVSRRIESDRLLGIRAEMWAYAVGMLITMLLCGAWHGVGWTFVLWGLWHGLFMVLENSRPGKRLLKKAGSAARYVLTQTVVIVGWVLFRSGGLEQAGSYLAVMAGFTSEAPAIADKATGADYLSRNLIFVLVLGCTFALPVMQVLGRWKKDVLTRIPVARVGLADFALGLGQVVVLCALLVLCAMSLAGGTYNPFIYRHF